MGVVGVGKTTVGKMLASKLGWPFADADDFHSPANIEKIRRGIALGDSDRGLWLRALHHAILKWNSERNNVVLACSALKRSYRDELRVGRVQFVSLEGPYELIQERLQARRGHFATESILKSQFEDLELPGDAIHVDVDKTPEQIADEIISKLKTFPSGVS